MNGFWASLGPGVPHTAYSAAKFAVKGFSEALLEDFRVNAPHVNVSVVMPGHIGTDIVINSRVILGNNPDTMSADEIKVTRKNMALRGIPIDGVSDEDLVKMVAMMGEMFRTTPRVRPRPPRSSSTRRAKSGGSSRRRPQLDGAVRAIPRCLRPLRLSARSIL